MKFSVIYPLLVNKAVRKGQQGTDVIALISWLTGYSNEQIIQLSNTDITYCEFFAGAPAMNPLRTQITGSICGIKLNEIEDPLMKEIRRLDKLIDELAKGKDIARITFADKK